jgi:hypothetical protein
MTPSRDEPLRSDANSASPLPKQAQSRLRAPTRSSVMKVEENEGLATAVRKAVVRVLDVERGAQQRGIEERFQELEPYSCIAQEREVPISLLNNYLRAEGAIHSEI